MNWKKITRDKEHGGLGMKDMADQNTALLGKAIWNLLANFSKLWVQVFKHKYLRGTSIMSVKQQHNDSPIWKGILKARDCLR